MGKLAFFFYYFYVKIVYMFNKNPSSAVTCKPFNLLFGETIKKTTHGRYCYKLVPLKTKYITRIYLKIWPNIIDDLIFKWNLDHIASLSTVRICCFSLSNDSKWNIVCLWTVVWTTKATWRLHLGLWETVMGNFHYFQTFYGLKYQSIYWERLMNTENNQ